MSQLPKPAKPFLKWVGGKTKLVPELVAIFPKKFNNYFEPFVGGGALFYEVIQKFGVKNLFRRADLD